MSHSTKKIRMGDTSAVQKSSSMEKKWTRGGLSRFSVGIFFSQSSEKLRSGEFPCVSEMFWYRTFS